MWIDDSSKFSFDYISSYTLAVIYEISLKKNSTTKSYVASISERKK